LYKENIKRIRLLCLLIL